MRNRGIIRAVALAAVVVAGCACAGEAVAQTNYPSVAGLKAFKQEASYMSLAGYLRHHYFLQTGRWISREEAENAVSSDGGIVAPVATTEAETKPAAAAGQGAASTKVVHLASGLKYQDLTVGTGALATAGKNVTVHYRGTLTNGKQFDASYDQGAPFSFNLGAGEVIQGWDEGVAGMRVGGKRKLTIPPALGYGARGAGDAIPPNATLIFEVELLKVN